MSSLKNGTLESLTKVINEYKKARKLVEDLDPEDEKLQSKISDILTKMASKL